MKIITRDYRSVADYRKDAPRLARQGYTPATTLTHTPSRSAFGTIAVAIATGGLGLLFGRPKPHTLVTYRCEPCK